SLPELFTERARLLDLAAAIDALIATRERLRDRRSRPQHVDDDAHGSVCRFGRCERDVDAHRATTLPRWPPRGLRCTATGTRTARRGSPARSADAASARIAWSSLRSESAVPTTRAEGRARPG